VHGLGDLAALPWPEAGRIQGRVLAPDGSPVAGALVELPDWWVSYFGRKPCRTDAEGAFRFEREKLIPARVRVQAAGHPDFWGVVDPRGEVLVRMPRGGEVAGRVVDRTGHAVPRASLAFHSVGGDGTIDQSCRFEPDVDSLGRFRLLLVLGRYRPGFLGARGESELGPECAVEEGRTTEVLFELPWDMAAWR
jgi:hypothetical protein